MQIAGKHVAHVEKYIDVMDRGSTETVMNLIGKAILEHRRVQDEITDPLNRYEFEQIFAEEMKRAEEAYAACERKLAA